MKRMKKGMLSATLVALVVAGGTVVAAQPASAVLSQCPAGSMCAWQNGGYGGAFINGGISRYNYSGTGMNDAATSLYNYATKRGVYYADAGYAGTNIALAAGGTWNDLWNTNLQDQISSNRRDN